MPFGLLNAPATFQRTMERFRNGILILVYLDVIVICSQSFNQHIKDFQDVFKRLTESGFRVSQDKCKFICPEVTYLGHVLTKNGIKVDKKMDQF